MARSPYRTPALFAGLTAVGIVAALVTQGSHWLPAARWHLVFAVCALPLILAAITYFVPVLTRSDSAPRALAAVPLTAVVAGIGISAFFVHGLLVLRLAAPWIALLAVAGLAAWITLRWRHCIGHPNPCLHWYAAALGMLAAGQLAVGVSPYLPEQARALRVIHIHLNTLGFIGLTALGTLQVLLPTVAGRPDPEGAVGLARDLKWSAAGAVAIALGAAFAPQLAVAGAALYAWPLVRLALHAWDAWRREIVTAGTTVPLLISAILGLTLVLGQGVAHAGRLDLGADDIPLFVIAFLLPLVSGAAGHLLPVWLKPGPQESWHIDSRKRLALGARLRGLGLLVGGALAADGQAAGYALGIFGAAWLAGSLAAAAFRHRN